MGVNGAVAPVRPFLLCSRHTYLFEDRGKVSRDLPGPAGQLELLLERFYVLEGLEVGQDGVLGADYFLPLAG